MRQKAFAALITILVLFPAAGLRAGSPAAAPDPISQYVQVRSQQEQASYSVDVTIMASLPSMGKVGKLSATRRQAPGGRFTYETMQFEGDNLIKTNVIARYLSAEMEAQRPDEKLATQISPANYEFKLKGNEMVSGREAFVYEVKPRKKRAGLFKGKIWIDAETRQPLKEEGKLSKLPSIWLKEIAFTRLYVMARGLALPARIVSEVKTRIVGKAEITVAYDNYKLEDSMDRALTPVEAGMPRTLSALMPALPQSIAQAQ